MPNNHTPCERVGSSRQVKNLGDMSHVAHDMQQSSATAPVPQSTIPFSVASSAPPSSACNMPFWPLHGASPPLSGNGATLQNDAGHGTFNGNLPHAASQPTMAPTQIHPLHQASIGAPPPPSSVPGAPGFGLPPAPMQGMAPVQGMAPPLPPTANPRAVYLQIIAMVQSSAAALQSQVWNAFRVEFCRPGIEKKIPGDLSKCQLPQDSAQQDRNV